MKKKQDKKTKKEFDITVHYSIEGRKKFKAKMIIRFIILLIFLAGCAVMVMFGGWKWDPNAGFSPTTDPKEGYQYALIWVGSTLAILAIAGYVAWTLKTFKKFYDTQAEYFKTKDFKEKKEKALKSDPTKLNKATIKWYKKLGYITGSQKNDWISRMKDSKKKDKPEKVKKEKRGK